jgi:DNA polymerase delta subunit 1
MAGSLEREVAPDEPPGDEEPRVRVEVSDLKHTLWGFTPDPRDPDMPEEHCIARVICSNLEDLETARDASVFATNPSMVICEAINSRNDGSPRMFNVVQQFLDSSRALHGEAGVQPCGWVRVEHGSDSQDSHSDSGSHRVTHCDLEIACPDLSHVHGLPDLHAPCPYVLASSDIECFGSAGFPTDSIPEDKVICIGTTLRVATGDDMLRVVQCLGDVEGAHESGAAPDPEIITMSYASELELLVGWRDLIVVYADADIITGYNLHGFDYAYMVNRYRLLLDNDDAHDQDDRFLHLGRVINQKTFVPWHREGAASNDRGARQKFFPRMSGRVTVDMLQWISGQQSRFKLESYRLDNVARTYLDGNKKVDLDPKRLFDLFLNGGAAGMREIAEYCAKDCDLPLLLMSKLQTLTELGELAKITSTPLHDVMSRGQQVQVFNQILMYAHGMGYVVNPIPVAGAALQDDTKYEGATVISPAPGFYDDPIATLDFNSLYPSIMQTHNLSFDTYVLPGVDRGGLGRHAVHTTSDGREHVFVEGKEGVLPCILRTLLAARKSVKKQMKTARDDPQLHALLDGRQLAIKISANSVYGFTGVGGDKGFYPNLAIAETTTLEGRRLIHETKRMVEEEEGHEVIYGDTDSVMVRFASSAEDAKGAPEKKTSDEQRLREAYRLGEALADRITARFPKQIVIEMEKIFFPMLLVAKKRYAGLKYTRVEEPDGVDVKGMEIVRRDTSGFARRVMTEVLDTIMHTRDIGRARAVLGKHLEDIREDRVPFEDFVMSKALRDHYTNTNLPHLTVVRRIEERKGEVPRSGDRVPFVIVRLASGDGDAKFYEKAEDPAYARSHGVPIDTAYYVEKQVMTPICTLFRPFDRHPEELFVETLATIQRKAQRMRRLVDCLTPGEGHGGKGFWDVHAGPPPGTARKPVKKPAKKPAKKQVAKPVTKPVTKPATKPATKPTTQQTAKPRSAKSPAGAAGFERFL